MTFFNSEANFLWALKTFFIHLGSCTRTVRFVLLLSSSLLTERWHLNVTLFPLNNDKGQLCQLDLLHTFNMLWSIAHLLAFLAFKCQVYQMVGNLKPANLNDFLFWIKSELILLESFLFYYYYLYFISDEFGKNNSNNENIVQNIIKG